ncbi:MAG: hypothetical protein Kow00108_16650 [Calditrichia bacterium]
MRYEYKYYLTNQQAQLLLDMMTPFVREDKYLNDIPQTTYVVRSLYMDTPNLDYYHDKVEGLNIRKKVRVRCYNSHVNTLFFEIKRKMDRKITKVRQKINIRSFTPALLTKLPYQLNIEHSELKKIYFYITKEILRPILLVVYDRAAFHSKFYRDLRITLDYNLRTRFESGLDKIATEDNLVPVLPGKIILEIKFTSGLPEWLINSIQILNLERQAISKYVLSLDKALENHVFSRNSKMIFYEHVPILD